MSKVVKLDAEGLKALVESVAKEAKKPVAKLTVETLRRIIREEVEGMMGGGLSVSFDPDTVEVDFDPMLRMDKVRAVVTVTNGKWIAKGPASLTVDQPINKLHRVNVDEDELVVTGAEDEDVDDVIADVIHVVENDNELKAELEDKFNELNR